MENYVFSVLKEMLFVLTPAYLTGYGTLLFLRSEKSILRLISFAFLVAVYSFIRAKLRHPTALLDALILVIGLLVLQRDYTFISFIKTLFTYLIIYGISLIFKSILVDFLDPNDTLLSMILSLSIVFSTVFVRILTFLTLSKNRPKRIYEVVVFNGKKEYKTKGYLDTGNALYSRGNPVVVVSEKVARTLSLHRDRVVRVQTVAGEKNLAGGKAGIKIFLDKKTHKVLPIVYAISDKMNSREYEVLLHSDMELT